MPATKRKAKDDKGNKSKKQKDERKAIPNDNMNLTINIKKPADILKMTNVTLKFLETFRFQIVRGRKGNKLELISIDSARVALVRWSLVGLKSDDDKAEEHDLLIDTDKNYDFTLSGIGFQSALASAVKSQSNLIIQMGTDDSKLLFKSVNNRLSSFNNIDRQMVLPLIDNGDDINDLGIPVTMSAVMDTDTFNECFGDISGFAADDKDTVYIKLRDLNAEQMTAVFRLATHPEENSVGCVINGNCKYLPRTHSENDSVKLAIASHYVSKLVGAKLASEVYLDIHENIDDDDSITYLLTYTVTVPTGEFKVSMASRVEEL